MVSSWFYKYTAPKKPVRTSSFTTLHTGLSLSQSSVDWAYFVRIRKPSPAASYLPQLLRLFFRNELSKEKIIHPIV